MTTSDSCGDPLTAIVDRGGRRVRFYRRKRLNSPGMKLRREKAKEGMNWCRGCAAWVPAHLLVPRAGACQSYLNAETRALYARSEKFREARKAHRDRRRRNVERLSPAARDLLAEIFDQECAYCDHPAETWDHAIAVTQGGKTVPGNMVPSCHSCNSRKKAMPLERWLERAPAVKPFTFEYFAHFEVL